MLSIRTKVVLLALLISTLTACDKPAQDAPAPPPAPAAAEVVKEPATLTPPAAPKESGLAVSWLAKKLSFSLPLGFSDQTAVGGVEQQAGVATQLFLDSKTRQLATTSVMQPTEGQRLDMRDATLSDLAKGILAQLQSQYLNISQTQSASLMVGKQKFWRLDSSQTVNGQPLLSTILVTVMNKQILSLQVVTPAKTADVHQAAVEHIIASLVRQ